MSHIHKLIDFTVVCYIVYGNKVLLIHHKKLNKWLPISGHIELDEDPEQALFREIEEECGLEVEIVAEKPDLKTEYRKFLLTPTYLDIHPIDDTHKHIGMTYFGKAKSDAVKLAEKEHHEIRWFTIQDVESPKYELTEDIKFYIEEALKITN